MNTKDHPIVKIKTLHDNGMGQNLLPDSSKFGMKEGVDPGGNSLTFLQYRILPIPSLGSIRLEH